MSGNQFRIRMLTTKMSSLPQEEIRARFHAGLALGSAFMLFVLAFVLLARWGPADCRGPVGVYVRTGGFGVVAFGSLLLYARMARQNPKLWSKRVDRTMRLPTRRQLRAEKGALVVQQGLVGTVLGSSLPLAQASTPIFSDIAACTPTAVSVFAICPAAFLAAIVLPFAIRRLG